MKPRQGYSTRAYRPEWVRALTGPLGRRIPSRWLEKRDRGGNSNIWVIHTDSTKECPGQYLIRHWQVSPQGQIRKAVFPQLVASNLLEARGYVPYELNIERCEAESPYKIIEIWY